MKNFDGFGLNPALRQSLAQMKYKTPTPIQAEAIPLALKGRDILGSAQTGTGKTAAFAIPLVERLLNNPHGSALVLTPTRELGKQIMDIMSQLLSHSTAIKSAFIIGGESMGKQLNQLRQNPRLIVGTPGRINDHLQRGTLKLHDTSFLVLDETDRMLDMGFSIQLERIFKHMPEKRQTLMFSATLPHNILKLADNYLSKPERIAVGSTTNPAKNINQQMIRLNENEKYGELLRQLEDRRGSIIVFVKTKHGADRMAKNLGREDFDAEAIHGDLRQGRRDRVIREFRNKKFRILVATDVAARGLDIPHIEHVINYDLPQVPEDYIHRIGRTARAGAEGEALCLITPQDGRRWFAIEQLMNPDKKKSKDGKKSFDKQKGKKNFRGKKRFDSFNDNDRDDDKYADKFVGKPEHKNKPKKKSAKRPEKDTDKKFEKRSEERQEHRPKKNSKKRAEKRPEKKHGKRKEFNKGERVIKAQIKSKGPKKATAKKSTKNTAKDTSKRKFANGRVNKDNKSAGGSHFQKRKRSHSRRATSA